MKNQTISTAKDILSSISEMKAASQKAWLTKNINQHTEYIRTIEDKFYNRKWKHYYGEPLNEEVIRFEVDQLRELMNARAFLNGEKVEKVEKVVNKPVAKQKSEAPKPSAPSATELALVELTKSVTNLTGQLGELTKIVTQNSKDIAALQSTINLTNRWLPEQPKVAKTTRKAKAVASAPAKVVEDKSLQPKKSSKSLLEELFGSFKSVKADKPKVEKPNHKEYNPYGSGTKGYKMARMEVR